MQIFQAFLILAALATARDRTSTVPNSKDKPKPRQPSVIKKSNISLDFESGTLQGFKAGNVTSYLNIPFAQPPIGPLRYSPPQPATTLQGKRDASNLGPRCLQVIDQFTSPDNSSEDCLQLNIYTPAHTEGKQRRDGRRSNLANSKLPVIVYIHGGSFNKGSGTEYDGTAFVEENQNTIIVTINYRLGIFGFLAGSELGAIGANNLGLLDMKMAFEWVRKNIAIFGGDPANVTAMGQSAGSIAIGALLLSQGGNHQLFDRAIMLSGAPGLLYQTPQTMQPIFDSIASKIGCTPGTSETLDCLRKSDSSVLNNAANDFQSFPIADGSFVTTQSLITLLYSGGQFSKIPIMLHNERDEGSIFPVFGGISTQEGSIAFMNSFVPFFTPAQKATMQELWSFANYPADRPELAGGDFFGDLLFQCPERLLAQVYTQAGQQVFYTGLTKPPVINVFAALGKDVGVYHGSEVPFVWKMDALIDSSELTLAKQIRTSIVNFAAGSAPSAGLSSFSATGNVFDFDTGKSIGDTRQAKCDFILSSIMEFFMANQ